MTPEDKSKIDELNKSLYSRSAPEIRTKRRFRFSRPEKVEVRTDWEHPEEPSEDVMLNKRYKNSSMSFSTKFFLGSIIFFVLAVGIGGYLLLNGANIISANNIDIIVNGPISTAGGDPVNLEIQVHNKNNIKLQAVDMTVDFPSGTVDAVDSGKELKEFHELMDDILPGGVAQKNIGAVIYGEENTKKEIVVNISYRVAGSNAIFKKQKTYEILISSSPLSLSISSFKEVTSGQDLAFEVTLTSNSNEVLRNILLKAVYPFGFTFVSSVPAPQNSSGLWAIGDIPPKAKKTIKISGRLEGQDDEVRVFNFTAGIQSSANLDSIATEFISAKQDVSIKRPFITAAIAMNDNSDNGDYIGSFNSPIRSTISWFNNLPTAITDGEVHVKLSGNAFDKVSVDPGDGYYKSADNEIVWNKVTTGKLGSIGAGEEGSVSFSVTPRNFSTPFKSVINPNLLLDVSIQGKRVSESNVPENVVSSTKRLVKVSSAVNLSSAVIRSSPPFENTGPIPPRAEQPTTYTILWTIDNSSNTISAASVKSSLPAYVKWTGKTSPSGEDISYNANTNEIVWNVGNLDSNALENAHRRQVAFQVSITPSVSQVRQIPALVQRTTLVGEDDFTGENLGNSLEPLTTNFSTDPSYRDGDGTVVP